MRGNYKHQLRKNFKFVFKNYQQPQTEFGLPVIHFDSKILH